MQYLGLCAIVKDEDPFLEEWICHHALLGVEAFIIYDNGSAYPVRERLSHFMKDSFLTVVDMPGKGRQMIAYGHCLRAFGRDFRWLGFLDLDEYAIPKRTSDLRVLLQDYEDAAALGLNWQCFGTGGHKARPRGTQLENYVLALDREYLRQHIKSFVWPQGVAGIWSPHFAVPFKGGHTVNECHEPIDGPFSPFSAQLAQINHYHYRSWQDYYAKLLRGRAVGGRRHMPEKISPPAGDVPDMSALRFVSALRAMLEREDRALCLARHSKRFSHKLPPEQILAEACALIAHDRQEEALVLLSRAAAREPGQGLYDQARRMLKASLTAAA
ncbi:MAG: glycosyltransferase family 92 protein [Desulfovibrionaceae bacterium]|nr:glycosyltransferase family 92 protein [Desulfovibrionaceae bacterium]